MHLCRWHREMWQSPLMLASSTYSLTASLDTELCLLGSTRLQAISRWKNNWAGLFHVALCTAESWQYKPRKVGKTSTIQKWRNFTCRSHVWICLRLADGSHSWLPCACSTTSDCDIGNVQVATRRYSRNSLVAIICIGAGVCARNFRNSAQCSTGYTSWGIYKFISTVLVYSR